MRRLSEHTYVATEFQGCTNGCVATPDGVVVIDPPMRPTSAVAWRREVETLGQVRYVVNTEHHRDHILGNAFFPGTVVAHELTRRQFLESLGPVESVRERVAKFGPEELPLVADYRPRLPEITVSEELTLHLGGIEVRLIRMPGHLPNNLTVYLPQEGVLFGSDNLFLNSLPFLNECLPEEWLRTLARMQAMDAETLVPGHGEVSGKEAIEPFAAFLREITAQVQEGISQGWTREETAERLSFLDRFPIEPHSRHLAPVGHRLSLLRLHDVLTMGSGAPPLPL
ncbi:MAG: MBL fold metallo-hydrolase [Deltaproteobacteria bacterium]|nr:MBL fold metallo-hydrolase [Deltaproteobacteria bacterium]